MQGAYEKGIVHHDISSQNIMLTGEGKAVLNDWDWAGRKEDPGPSVVRVLLALSRLDADGIVQGTWRFMSTMMLENPLTHKQDLLDDLQALFWVFVHGVLRDFTPGYRAPRDYALDYKTTREDGVSIGGRKKSIGLFVDEERVHLVAVHKQVQEIHRATLKLHHSRRRVSVPACSVGVHVGLHHRQVGAPHLRAERSLSDDDGSESECKLRYDVTDDRGQGKGRE